MPHPVIDWARMIENTKLDDFIGLQPSPYSFFEREVFNLQVRSHEEDRAESIGDDMGMR